VAIAEDNVHPVPWVCLEFIFLFLNIKIDYEKLNKLKITTFIKRKINIFRNHG